MIWRTMICNSRARSLIVAAATAMLAAGDAFASQGPGTQPGTASASTQLVMAIVVYGICAAALVAGAIGAFRTTR